MSKYSYTPPQPGQILAVGKDGALAYQAQPQLTVDGSMSLLDDPNVKYGHCVPSLDPYTVLDPLRSVLTTVYVLYEAAGNTHIRRHVTDDYNAAINWSSFPGCWYETKPALDINGNIVLIERVTLLSTPIHP